MSSVYGRRYLPLAILWVVFIIYITNYFTGEFELIYTEISGWGTLIGLFLIFTATLAYMMRSISEINNFMRKGGEKESFILHIYEFVLFFSIIIIFFVKGMEGEQFQWVESYLYLPGQAVAWGFLPAYLSAAVYRTWRIRSWESFLLVICFILVMIKGAPISGSFPVIIQPGIWLTNVMEKGPFRVLQMGAGIGIMIMIIRGLRGRLVGYE